MNILLLCENFFALGDHLLDLSISSFYMWCLWLPLGRSTKLKSPYMNPLKGFPVFNMNPGYFNQQCPWTCSSLWPSYVETEGVQTVILPRHSDDRAVNLQTFANCHMNSEKCSISPHRKREMSPIISMSTNTDVFTHIQIASQLLIVVWRVLFLRLQVGLHPTSWITPTGILDSLHVYRAE